MNYSKINESLDKNLARLESFTFMEDLEIDEFGAPNEDLGTELDLDRALTRSDADEIDIVDDAIMDVIDMLVDSDYPEETAEEAVFDALATLVNDGSILDTPDAEATDDEKVSWTLTSVPKLKSRLKELGLEFDETV